MNFNFQDFRKDIFGHDMAVDLGTAITLVYVKSVGIVLNEPSVVAIDKDSGGKVLAVGLEAKRMIGRTPGNIMAIRPLKDGVITDFDVTEKMLHYFINRIQKPRFFFKPRPKLVICIPSGITGVERRAVEEAGEQAGARTVFLIEEPMAAAIGANIAVHESSGNMIVDIGGGTTEVAVISMGGIVTVESIRVAGDEIDEAIAMHLKNEHKLIIGEITAENLKIGIGSAYPIKNGEEEAEVRGRDITAGLPKTIVISSEEIRYAIKKPVDSIIDAIKVTLDKTPPELSSDIMDKGIVLTGGGALLRELGERIKVETNIPVHIAEDPLACVALGAGKCIEDFDHLKNVLISLRK